MSNFNNSTNSRECWVFSLKVACLTLVVFVGVIGGSASLADAVSKSKNWISVTGQVIALKDCGESCTRKSNGNNFCSNTLSTCTVMKQQFQILNIKHHLFRPCFINKNIHMCSTFH